MRVVRILGHQFDGMHQLLISGFEMYRKPLAKQLGIQVEITGYQCAATLKVALARPGADMTIVMPRFAHHVDDLCEQFAMAREANPRMRLILLDGHDPVSSPHFAVLPHVDRYIKSKMFRNPNDYQVDYKGGHIFADFYARQYDFDIGDWRFGTIPDPAFINRVVPGWNFAVAPRMRKLAKLNRLFPKPLQRRKYDLSARLALIASDTQKQWYQDYRRRSHKLLESMPPRLKLTPQGRIGQLRLLREYRQCRMVFSPFGWGEVCLRDYEAVASGALLLKPSMSHLVTSPDIYVDGQTCVSIKWDLTDLEEKIDWCLSNPENAQLIARNAHQTLCDYYERGGFVADVQRTMMPVFDCN